MKAAGLYYSVLLLDNDVLLDVYIHKESSISDFEQAMVCLRLRFGIFKLMSVSLYLVLIDGSIVIDVFETHLNVKAITS